MLLNLITLYLIMTVALTIYLAAFIFLNGRAIYMKIVGVESILVTIYVFGYMLELHAKNLQDAIFWNCFQYLAIPFLNAIWVLMSLMYIGTIKKIKDWRVNLMFIIPVGTLIIRFTNHWNHLYYTSYKINRIDEFQLMVLGKGTWYWIQSLYIVITSIVSVYVFFRAYYNCKSYDRIKYKLLLMASLIPIGCEVAIYTITKSIGFDPMAFFLPIAVALMTYATVHYDFLEIKTLARDELFESSNDCMLVLNNSMRIIDYNQNAIVFFKKHGIDLAESDLQDYYEQASELINVLKSTAEVVYVIKESNSTDYWKIETRNVSNNRNEIYGQLKTIRNVTNIIEAQKYLERVAITDELSQLNNRRKFIQSGTQMVTDAVSEKSVLTLIMIDIDHFKNVNDTFGHQVGDEVIQGIAGCLSLKFKEIGMISRIGGEEFTVIMHDYNLEKSYEYAEDFRKYVEKSRILKNIDYQVTISIGVAELTEGDTLIELMKRADRALYKAKNSGRNQVCIYEV